MLVQGDIAIIFIFYTYLLLKGNSFASFFFIDKEKNFRNDFLNLIIKTYIFLCKKCFYK